MSVSVKPRTTGSLSAPMPAPPVRQFSFTDWQVNNPTSPPPGDRLDAEFDRANNAIDDTIDWASVSLNTDGSIRDGVIGENNLQPGLFDEIGADAVAEVQPLVDQAAASAVSASQSALLANTSAANASTYSAQAQNAAGTSLNNSNIAGDNARAAGLSATAAATSATDADNADNHATGAAAEAQAYADVTQAWAEHMPNTIPPNILAVMGVTGDHWSSRWWANKAAGAFGALSELYLGVWAEPPTSTSTGDPIPIGAIYYNSTNETVYLWNGTAWVPFWTPVKSTFLSLLYRAAANQTVFPLATPDLGGHVYTISSTNPELVDIYVNGVRLPSDTPNPGSGDWTLNAATSTVTFLSPLLAGSLVQVDILTPSTTVAGVSTFNTRSGDVHLTSADVAAASGLLTTGGTITGDLTVTGSQIIGGTLVVNGTALLHAATATTPGAGDSSTNIATTAFVTAAVPLASTTLPLINGSSAPGTSTRWSRGDHVHPIDTSRYAASNPAGYQTAAQVTAALPLASSTTPIMDGVATPGTSIAWAHGDHVHPSDTSRYAASNPAGYQTAAQVTASLGAYLPLSGGNLSGPLNVTNGLGVAAASGQDAALVLSRASGHAATIDGFTGNSPRWQVLLGDANPETGGNAGSNFAIGRFDDGGTVIDQPLAIIRSTGWTVIQNLEVPGQVACYGAITCNGQVTCNAVMNNSGTFYVAGDYNYYLARNPADGAWRFVENTTTNFTVTVGGDVAARGHVFAGANDTYIGAYGSGGAMNFLPNYTLACSEDGSGWLRYYSNTTLHTVWRPSDWLFYNNISSVAGYGAYIDLSDVRSKRTFAPAQTGLAEILRLLPVMFERYRRAADERPPTPELGFIAQDVLDVIPEAVEAIGLELPDGSGGIGSDAPSLGIKTTPIIAALVNAIKELTQRIQTLEARSA
jgi:hypothetical protein